MNLLRLLKTPFLHRINLHEGESTVKEASLQEIIPREEDRLFIIDRECYIIFTGSTLSDERPFIRLGNYIDLPVEIIPQIENIVITDLLVGNPAFEQFNIDVRTLSHNRYIGSLPVVTKYLDFHKVFGLDLKNAKIVDVEKDVPFIHNKKELKDAEAFIGIFYTNGNFKIHHQKKFLLDLVRETEAAFNEKKLMDRLVGSTRESGRYDGDGMVIVGQTPFFYKNGSFTPYHFPKYFLEDFARMSIDPSRIGEVIHPSANFIHLSRLLRWKHARGERLTIITDHREQFSHIQKLFSKAALARKDFSNFSLEMPHGLSISAKPGSFNIEIRFSRTRPHRLDINITYVKGSRTLSAILKEKQDGIIIPSSIYEEYAAILRSGNMPLLVIADTDFAQKKLRDSSIILMQPGFQYEFRKYPSFDDLHNDLGKILPPEIFTLTSTDIEKAARGRSEIMRERQLTETEYAEAQNLISACRLLLAEEKDRKKAEALRKAIHELSAPFNRMKPRETSANMRSIIAFCGSAAYEFIDILPEKNQKIPMLEEISEQVLIEGNDIEANEKEFCLRVMEDRKRLRKLLELLRPAGDEKDFRDLSRALHERKAHYYTEEPSAEFSLSEERSSIKIIKKVVACIVIAVAATFIIFSSIKIHREELENREKLVKLREAQERKELIDRYQITVSPHDIFVFANKIALENGYRPITYKGLKEKNPNWIYPGNRFTIESEHITVKEGDTLWDIAHERLMDRNIKFYRVFELLKNAKQNTRDFTEKLRQAEELAFSETHKKIIAAHKDGRTDGGKGQK